MWKTFSIDENFTSVTSLFHPLAGSPSAEFRLCVLRQVQLTSLSFRACSN